MIFSNLSTMQNILFLLACLGVILLVVYIICVITGFVRSKKSVTSDDIDDAAENYNEPTKFIYNAFTIKGSILWLAVTFSLGFFLSLFINPWIALLIGFVVAVGLVLLMAFLDREPLAINGEIAIVTETIPSSDEKKSGKIIVMSDSAELNAFSNGKEIKKGKKVLIVKNLENNTVIVKKFKRHS